jgi:hypothetical protein
MKSFLCNFHSSTNIMKANKSRRMRWTRYGTDSKCIYNLYRKIKGKISRGWEDGVKLILNKTDCEEVAWIQLRQDKATLTLDTGSDPIRIGPTDLTIGRKTNTQSCIRALTLQPTRLVWSTWRHPNSPDRFRLVWTDQTCLIFPQCLARHRRTRASTPG